MELFFYSPAMEENDVYLQQQMEIEQIPVNNTVTQTTNSNNRGHHRWNSLVKVKNKLNNLKGGMY